MINHYLNNFTKILKHYLAAFMVSCQLFLRLPFSGLNTSFIFNNDSKQIKINKQPVILFSLFLILSSSLLFGQTTVTLTSTGTWTAPACVNSIDVGVWGGGGAGGGEPNSFIAPPAAGGGGGGGAYLGATLIAVVPGTVYTITVGAGGAGSAGNGQDGLPSSAIFGGTTLSANGGKGGKTGSNGAGGAGGIAAPGGRSGGAGFAGLNSGIIVAAGYGGGGGGGAGTSANGSNGSANGVAGAGGTGNTNGLGGKGGDPNALNILFQTSGAPGTAYGGGGGGANSALIAVSGIAGNATGGNGANGAVVITYTPGGGVNTMTSASAATMCSGNSINIPLGSTQPSSYTYIATDNTNTTGESLTLQNVSSGGSLTDIITNNSTSDQNVIYTVTPIATAGGCAGTPQIVTVTVKPLPVLSSTLTPAAICSGTTFTYNATSASASPTFAWNRPTIIGITEPGTPGVGDVSETLTNTTASPINVTYVYTTTSGTCVGNTQNVVVTVNSNATIALTSGAGTDTKSVCLNTAITAITYTVSGGATGAIATRLPAGVSGVYGSGTFTISGIPSVSGVYNYSVTTTGACPPATANGTITVGTSLTSPAGTDSQSVCINTPITNIDYAIAGAGGGAGATGLPPGVSGVFSAGIFTISGTPNAAGAWNYTVTATGPCAPDDATGIITVGVGIITQGADTQRVCKNTPITNIAYRIVGGDAPAPFVVGLPAGVSGTITAPGVFTISGTPSIEGFYTYTITTNGSCASQSSLMGNITVGIGLISIPGTDTQKVCKNSPIVDIVYGFAGGDAPPPTIAGLPAGITGGITSPGVYTISGTPSVEGLFNYTLTTHGSCATQSSLSGSITVGLGLKVAGNDTQSICKNTPILDIVYTFAGGNVPPPSITGLPAGVSGSVTNSGEFTIAGTPSVEGAFVYTITTSGSCSPQSILSGRIIVGLGLKVSGTDIQSVCKNTPITNIDYIIVGGDAPAPSIGGLPAGVSGSVTSPGVFTISGTPTIEGVFNYTVTTNGSCLSQSSLSGSIAVGLQLTSAIGTDSQKICKKTPIVDIVYAFSGGSVPSDPSIIGLPAGVTGAVSSPGVFTISGTPTVEGLFTYTLTTHGTCAAQSSLSGSITVGIGLKVPGTDTQSVCKNTPITDIVYKIIGGDTPAPTVVGLPGGVSGSITSAGIFTINGTPSVEGTFIYTVTTAGSCATQSNLSGSITVGIGLKIPRTDTQSVCKNSPIIDINYAIVGGDIPAPSVIGLPAGVSGSITSPGVFTITGTPTIEGVFNYTITTNGSCLSQSSLSGRIAVGFQLTSTVGTDSQKVCKKTPIANIVYAFSGGSIPSDPSIAGLPAGVTGAVSSPGVFTISGTPTVEGLFTYTLTTHGSCAAQSSLSGSITVGLGLKMPGTDTQSVCKNTPIADIAYSVVGGDAPAPMVVGLPTGVSGSITSPGIFTISGTPSIEGSFIYTITTKGSCATQSSLSGNITVGIGLKIPGLDTQSVCKNTPITDINYSIVGGDVPAPSITGLPGGVSGSVTSPGVFTISGTPTTEGVFNYTITTNGSCLSQSSLSGMIAVGLQLTSAIGTDSQKVCKKTPIINIVYAFSGGVTPAPPTIAGLPAGVTGGISSQGIFTISGTPSVEGLFNYTLTTHGSCAAQSSLSGSITVGVGLKIPGLDTQSVCKNTAIADIPYTIVGGDVPPPTVTGLPAGVSSSITSTGVLTISGIPSIEGTFIYTITTNGSCATQSSLNGSITVGIGLKVPGTDIQSVCKNTPISDIPYAIVGGDAPPPVVTGLPAGVGGSITSPGVFTIGGTPSVEGVFNYTVTTSGSCNAQSHLTGSITINNAAISLPLGAGSNNQKVCNKTPIENIVYAISGTGTGATVSTLPTGLTGSYNAGVLTISGSPDTTAGIYTFTITPIGSCTQGSTTFTIAITSPKANFSVDTNSGGPPLLVNFTNNSQDATAYAWSFDDGTNDTVFNTKHSFTALGVYNVQLIASYNSQCPDTATSKIIVYKFTVPNIFTPNGDNINDLFIVNSTGIKSLDVEIYNRWGSRMAEWHTVGGGWDGHNAATNGECPAGVYYYLIKASDIDGGHYTERGTITLIR